MTAVATEVRERPILFSAPMIRALLDERKTQTRRALKVQPLDVIAGKGDERGRRWYSLMQRDPSRGGVFACRYGAPGDRLWVRETWGVWPGTLDEERQVLYRATVPDAPDGWPLRRGPIAEMVRWRPSIHMPRWACRIVLELTDVRVERLQDITADDATAEGFVSCTKDGKLFKHGLPDRDGYPGGVGWPWDEWRVSPIDAYRALWDQINAKRGYGWDVNPWVWVLSFRRLAEVRHA